jgi:aubergine-like protein
MCVFLIILNVGALVCSLNETFTKYYSEVDYHSSNTEVSNNVNSSLMNGLVKYQQENKCLPERIFVYRDGVGDGQIQFVYEHELRAMREGLKSFWPSTPKLTFIIVSKRINTRFFTKEKDPKIPPRNPPSGTVVDDVVTLPERYDFYVISQSVRQGLFRLY